MSELKSSIGSGFLGGLIGSLCCVTPLVLVLVGLSGVSGAMALAGNLQQTFRWTVFIPIAIIFLFIAMYFHIKRRAGVCNLRTIKRYKTYVIVTILFAIIIWASLIYVIVPGVFRLFA